MGNQERSVAYIVCLSCQWNLLLSYIKHQSLSIHVINQFNAERIDKIDQHIIRGNTLLAPAILQLGLGFREYLIQLSSGQQWPHINVI